MVENHIVCRCEEITREDILKAIQDGHRTVSSIKRATRAGMGACQGRTCGRLIQQILSSEAGIPRQATMPDKARFPLVPCEMGGLGGGCDE